MVFLLNYRIGYKFGQIQFRPKKAYKKKPILLQVQAQVTFLLVDCLAIPILDIGNTNLSHRGRCLNISRRAVAKRSKKGYQPLTEGLQRSKSP